MAESRETDLVLAPNEFIFIQDLNTGLIKPIVGPTKKTLDSTEQPVIYLNHKFIRCAAKDGIQIFPVVDERSYLILENPAIGEKEHPVRGQDNPMPAFYTGQKKNIPGPATFALWPGQVATALAGHQLRSNQYLRCVVHNSKEAMANWDKAIIDTTDSQKEIAADSQIEDSQKDKRISKFVTGQILIIKGKEVSYYIPPTGINVIPDESGKYVRDAVTLERLEYCILLDESGEKRYVKGPAVVFPQPTETFIEKNKERKFQAIELNENMGIYIKVIADYETHKAGEELFISGKEQKIYYPRTEHAIIKYDDQVRHYAIAIPKGEARYVLNKDTGEIKTVVGPKMFLPDPRHEVIVRRILTDKEVNLWFPGNAVALEHNRTLQRTTTGGEKFARYMSSQDALSNIVKGASVLNELVCDDLTRQTSYTPPRTITIDSKFEGAVNINVWPGYAVQVVSKNGDREVVIGPKSVVLEYDQTLEVMELSTGKPKTDHDLIKTVYLRVKNNRVSDIIEADTKDMVHISARVNYRVNFEGDPKQWYSVENYVKFLTQNLRSIVRNEVQKHGIEEISQKITSIIRDLILGVSEGKERTGRIFPENGMRVYDVEVLTLEIGDEQIRTQLTRAQHETVKNTLNVAAKKQELESTLIVEECEQKMIEAQSATQVIRYKITKSDLQEKAAAEDLRGKINDITLKAKAKDMALISENERTLSEIRTEAFERRFKAITPELIAALEASGNTQLAKIFAEHIPQAGNGVGMVLGQTLVQNILGMVKGTAIEKSFQTMLSESEKKGD